MEKQDAKNPLLPLVIILSIAVGGLGMALWQKTQSQDKTIITIAPEQNEVRVEAEGMEPLTNSIEQSAERAHKIEGALYAIQSAKAASDNTTINSELDEMRDALTSLRDGQQQGSQVERTLRQGRSAIDATSAEPVIKDPILLQVDRAIDVAAWCAARP